MPAQARIDRSFRNRQETCYRFVRVRVRRGTEADVSRLQGREETASPNGGGVLTMQTVRALVWSATLTSAVSGGIFLTTGTSTVQTAPVFASQLKCDLTDYRASSGLTAEVERDVLVVPWEGEGASEVRARYAIEKGQPVIRDLAARRSGGRWAPLGQNLIPEYYVVSGVRRMTTQQGAPIEQLGVKITPEVIEKNKWYAFWDAPLVMPAPAAAESGSGGAVGTAGRGAAASTGGAGRVYGAPRDPKEIRRANATFSTDSCSVKTDGARLEVTFSGLSMGIFSGSLRFTSYRGTNMFRME